MESVKISTDLAYTVRETNGNDIFHHWKEAGCEMILGETKNMLRLKLNGTAMERSKLRTNIFDALKKAQQKMKGEDKKGKRTVILEVQIPSSCCGILIGTDGETIKRIEAESGVQRLYIDTGRQKVNREPFSCLVICASDIERMTMALKQMEELLAFANKSDYGTVPMGRRNGGEKEDTVQRMDVVKLCIPAADFFTREQMRRFEQIKRSAPGVSFDLDSSDPGQSFRSVTLSGAKKNVSSVRTELKTLVDEVNALAPLAESGKKNKTPSNGADYASPPTEGPSATFSSFGCVTIQKKVNERTLNRKKANSGGRAPIDPVKPKKMMERFKKEVLVPQKCIVHVIGNGGENIRQLQDKFGVKMQFLGNNYLDYPNGRTLSISGDSEERVISARDHVDREFILKRWEAWNTHQHDNVSSETTCEEIYNLSPTFALREDLELAMMQMKDQSGILSYCYRQFCSGGRPIVLRGTKMTLQRAIKLLANMEQEWNQPHTLGHIRARSLDEISITSFIEPISMHSPGETQMKKPKGREEQNTDQTEAAESLSEAADEDFGDTCRDTDEDTLNESETTTAGEEDKMDERTGMDSNANVSTVGESMPFHQQQQSLMQGIQQITHSAFEKMNNMIAAKDAEIEQLKNKVTRILCTECGQSARSVLFTPCRHFLCCQKCADSVQNCPICKAPSMKLKVHFD